MEITRDVTDLSSLYTPHGHGITPL